jgi:hypothetical protein
VDQETGDSDPPVADRNFGRQETEFRSFREASHLAKAPSVRREELSQVPWKKLRMDGWFTSGRLVWSQPFLSSSI